LGRSEFPASIPSVGRVGVGQRSRSRGLFAYDRRSRLGRLLVALRIDVPLEHRQPRPARFVTAAFLAVVGSLAADRILVVIGTSIFPATKGYGHFAFSDYGKLTVIGVLGASVAWPIVTWISSSPRWVFFRSAVIVTVALWLPDLWILSKGQPPEAVLVLALMHLAIALVTYNALVHLAPASRPSPTSTPSSAGP
jgi:hypothetical protein